MSRRHRSFWRVRQRYRRLGFLGSVVGGAVVALLIAPLVQGAGIAGPGGGPMGFTDWLAPFGLAVALPPLVAWLAWRVHRRRFRDDLHQLPLR